MILGCRQKKMIKLLQYTYTLVECYATFVMSCIHVVWNAPYVLAVWPILFKGFIFPLWNKTSACGVCSSCTL